MNKNKEIAVTKTNNAKFGGETKKTKNKTSNKIIKNHNEMQEPTNARYQQQTFSSTTATRDRKTDNQ